MGAGFTNKQKAEIAYDLYMNTDYSQKEICEMIGWTEKTFSKHKIQGMWGEMKGAMQLTPERIIKNIYQRMLELSEEGQNIQADKLIKLANSIEKISNRKVTVSNIINVFKEFSTWSFGIDPEMTKQINELQKQFVNHKLNDGA